jgi:ketosteroid isomerase-like protein
MTVITDDLPARLLREEHNSWRALCDGTAGAHFQREMTADGVMVIPGMIGGRDQVAASFGGVPPFEAYEIREPRVVRLGDHAGILVYRAVATSGGQPMEFFASTTYVWQDGGWKVAAHQQTPASY